MERRIYVDNAATTQVAPEVFAAMIPHFCENYGNPSSIYEEGQTAKAAIEKAREQVADAIGAEAKEIYFTGSGSEADNWAIRSVAIILLLPQWSIMRCFIPARIWRSRDMR